MLFLTDISSVFISLNFGSGPGVQGKQEYCVLLRSYLKLYVVRRTVAYVTVRSNKTKPELLFSSKFCLLSSHDHLTN